MSVRVIGPPEGVRGSRLDVSLLRQRARTLMRALRIGGGGALDRVGR